MSEDPIVAEIHRTREKLAAEYNYDVAAFFADLRKRQAALGRGLVLQKKRAEPEAESRAVEAQTAVNTSHADASADWVVERNRRRG